jgi:DNA-binding protein H-NS
MSSSSSTPTTEQLLSLIQQQQQQLQLRENQYSQQMASFQQELQGLRTQANNSQVNNNNNNNSSSSSNNNNKYKSLYKPSQPPIFSGEHNNYIATQWLYKVELFFTVAKTDAEDKVNIAALSFDKKKNKKLLQIGKNLKKNF